MQINTSDFKKGLRIMYEGQPYQLTDFQHHKPGKGAAIVRTKMRNLLTGQVIDPTFRSGDKVGRPDLEDKEVQYLYNDGVGFVFMDSETYDQFTLNEEFAGDAMLYLCPNSKTDMLFHEGNPVVIELPSAVELKVEDTPPGIKGATVTNQLKEATLETGLKTRVPPFIEIGETVKVSTSDGSYMSRVKAE